MGAACMTYCNAAADCGAIFIKVGSKKLIINKTQKGKLSLVKMQH
jgi:hypothetical protein